MIVLHTIVCVGRKEVISFLGLEGGWREVDDESLGVAFRIRIGDVEGDLVVPSGGWGEDDGVVSAGERGPARKVVDSVVVCEANKRDRRAF